jgi:flagellar basal body-associated protein FliL
MGRYGHAARAFAGSIGSTLIIAMIVVMVGMAAYFVFHFLSIKKHQDKLTA